jgi:hypothetical protein
MPEPEAPQPVGHEANQEECKRGSLQGEEISRRVQFSGEPVRERKDSESKILMMAEKK